MILDIIAGVLSGILGAMGFGGGGVLILYLTLYKDLPQLTAQGINLLFFIPSAVLAIIIHSKNKLIQWKIVWKYIAFGLVGLAIGYMILSKINDNMVRKIFSIILIIIGAKELFKKSKN